MFSGKEWKVWLYVKFFDTDCVTLYFSVYPSKQRKEGKGEIRSEVGVFHTWTRQIFFRSRQASNMSNDSSSSDSSSSSSSSDSDSSSDGEINKFELSKAKSTCVAGWVVSGLGESKAKAAREAYRPKLRKCLDLLVNPSLDEAFYIRLRSIKSSSASKANIDPVEKIYRNQTYKILDLVKPLMFLASRVQKKKKTKADSKAIRTALKL